jgi:hypothetical protein
MITIQRKLIFLLFPPPPEIKRKNLRRRQKENKVPNHTHNLVFLSKNRLKEKKKKKTFLEGTTIKQVTKTVLKFLRSSSPGILANCFIVIRTHRVLTRIIPNLAYLRALKKQAKFVVDQKSDNTNNLLHQLNLALGLCDLSPAKALMIRIECDCLSIFF